MLFQSDTPDGACTIETSWWWTLLCPKHVKRWWCTNYLFYEIKHMCIKLVITNWLIFLCLMTVSYWLYFCCSSILCEKIRYLILVAICLSNKVYLAAEMKNAYNFTYSSKWVFVARCAVPYTDKLTFIDRVWFFIFLSYIFGPLLLMLVCLRTVIP
jgi:hypothetical protein